jgi:hypothetical protein
MEHPAFDIAKPPACEHLLLGFADSVPNFHAEDGSGYKFMADAVLKVCFRGGVVFWRGAGGKGGVFVRVALHAPSTLSCVVCRLAAAGGQGEQPGGVRPGGDAG